MMITIEKTIRADHVETFYEVYAAAFGPMQTRAAARHLLSSDEFAAEMADERIDKYVAWNDAGEPTALTTFTNDLSAIAWISPAFYAALYPAEYARGAVFYMGYTLLDPQRGTPRAFPAMVQRIVERTQQARGICVFDVCSYNDGRAVGRMWDRVARSGACQVAAVDVQTYYAASFAETPGGADFSTAALVDPARKTREGAPA